MKKTEFKLVNGDKAVIAENDKIKVLKSENYNFFFNKENGMFMRWGKTFEDDGDSSIMLPEIADIEIDTACLQNCSFCYKDNKAKGDKMSLETFKKIFDKITKVQSIGQIAFGITDIDSNPEMFDIFDYTREHSVIPNVTINGSRMTPELFDRLAKTMGAVAVSAGSGYNKDNSYNAVMELTNRGMTQVNIHTVIHSGNFDVVKQILVDRLNDTRLSKLSAVVILSLKPKGRAKDKYQPISQEKYTELIRFALDNKIGVGADSCGCFKFYNAIKDHDEYKKLDKYLDPCESTLTSLYINTLGIFTPCSFAEDIHEGISILECEDFINDVWYAEKTKKFREGVIACRSCSKNCSIYDI